MATDKKTLVPWVLVGILAVVATVAISVAVIERRSEKMQAASSKANAAAEAAKEEAHNEIETTSASDLVDSSPRAESLHGARDQLIDEFSDRTNDRIREILQRGNREGAP